MSVLLNGAPVTVVSDGAYNAFPGVCELPNGTLYAVYRAATTHTSFDGAIKFMISTDGGATWGSGGTIYDPGTANDDARDPGIIILANGTALLSYMLAHSSFPVEVYVRIGTITGSTISWGSAILACNAFTNVSAHAATVGAAIQLANGKILLSVYGGNTGDTFVSAGVVASTDNGATWGSLVLVATAPATIAYSELCFVQIAGGNVVGIIRNDTLEGYSRSVSTDNGATWSAPANVYSIGAVSAGKPEVLLLPSGEILLFSRMAGAGNRGALAKSSDDGVSWGTFAAYGASQYFAYASMINLGSSEIGSVIARETSSTDCRIVFQKFSERFFTALYTESFNKANSDVLGPDLTWNELEGDTDIVSNKAQGVTAAGGVVFARAEHDLPSLDHYAEAIVDATSDSDENYRGVTARQDAGATITGTGTFYLARVTNGVDKIQLFRCVGASIVLVEEVAFIIAANTPVLIGIFPQGSIIHVLADGVDAIAYDDPTPIVTGVRTGVWGANYSAGVITFESFAAGILIVTTPAISPASGAILTTDDITITCATAGADIYYTIDGSTPDATDTLYTGAFQLAADATVKAIGIKAAMTDSAVASSAYTVSAPSAGGPGTSHIEDLAGTRNGSNVTFTLAYTPNLNSLLVIHNTNTLYRDATIADKLRYSTSGMTITLGIAPQADADLWASYDEA